MPKFIQFDGLPPWFWKGGLAILDQGLYSGTNFVLSILLARWLNFEQYGIYALTLAIFQFVLQIQNGAVVEPMSVLGPARHQAKIDKYIRVQINLNFCLLVSMSLIYFLLFLFVWFYGSNQSVSVVQMLFGLLLPFLSLPWLVRRIFFMKNRPEISVLSSLLYAITLLGTTSFLYTYDQLTISSSIIVMGLAGCVTGVFVLPFLFIAKKSDNNDVGFLSSLRENWSYGRWSITTGLLVTIATQFQLFLATGLLGISAAGILRVSQNLIQPMTISITSISALALPTLSRDFGKDDFLSFEKKRKQITLLLVMMAFAYLIVMDLLRSQITYFLYGEKYLAYSDLIVIWSIIPVIMALNSGIGTGLRARQHPELVLLVSIIWSAFSIVIGFLFTNKWGIWGAAFSIMLGYLVAYLSTLKIYNRVKENNNLSSHFFYLNRKE